MVGTGKYRQTGAVWLLIILCGVALACLALPGTAASKTTTRSEGATEIKVAPDKVILETESITDIMGITTSEETPLDEGGPPPGWTSIYTGSSGDNYPTAMTAKRVGGQDYVYVAGRTKNPANDSGWDYLTIKYGASDGYKHWEATYDSGAKGFDEARAIAVDNGGNVYVTGYSTGDGTGADFATIKYNSGGGQVWVKRYNGPGNWDDYATAMTIDTQNNVLYVTGASEGKGTGWDYVTIKYGTSVPTDGQELWLAPAVYNYNEATNNMAGNRHDFPSAIALDHAGYVYVTGSSWRSRIVDGIVCANYDYATIKYAPSNGNQIKAKRLSSSGNGHDYASAIAVDGSNNVYVTGSSPKATTGYDFLTMAYKSDGSNYWTNAHRWDGLSVNSHAYAKGIALAGQNLVYVSGLSFKDGQSGNYATLRIPFDGQGNIGLDKFRSVNGPKDDWDEPAAIAVDGQRGFVYVTGSSYSTNSSDYRTIKYDNTYDFLCLWNKKAVDSADEGATAMALDEQGNVYVTGFATRSGWLMNIVTLQYPYTP